MSYDEYPLAYEDVPASQIYMGKDVTKHGLIWKKSGGRKLPLQSLYDQRFVIIHKGWVYYYKDKSSQKPQKKFSLRNFSPRVFVAEEEQASRSCVFKVYPKKKTDSARTWYFSTANEEEMSEWMDAFRQEIERYNFKPSTDFRGSKSVPNNPVPKSPAPSPAKRPQSITGNFCNNPPNFTLPPQIHFASGSSVTDTTSGIGSVDEDEPNYESVDEGEEFTESDEDYEEPVSHPQHNIIHKSSPYPNPSFSSHVSHHASKPLPALPTSPPSQPPKTSPFPSHQFRKQPIGGPMPPMTSPGPTSSSKSMPLPPTPEENRPPPPRPNKPLPLTPKFEPEHDFPLSPPPQPPGTRWTAPSKLSPLSKKPPSLPNSPKPTAALSPTSQHHTEQYYSDNYDTPEDLNYDDHLLDHEPQGVYDIPAEDEPDLKLMSKPLPPKPGMKPKRSPQQTAWGAKNDRMKNDDQNKAVKTTPLFTKPGPKRQDQKNSNLWSNGLRKTSESPINSGSPEDVRPPWAKKTNGRTSSPTSTQPVTPPWVKSATDNSQNNRPVADRMGQKKNAQKEDEKLTPHPSKTQVLPNKPKPMIPSSKPVTGAKHWPRPSELGATKPPISKKGPPPTKPKPNNMDKPSVARQDSNSQLSAFEKRKLLFEQGH